MPHDRPGIWEARGCRSPEPGTLRSNDEPVNGRRSFAADNSILFHFCRIGIPTPPIGRERRQVDTNAGHALPVDRHLDRDCGTCHLSLATVPLSETAEGAPKRPGLLSGCHVENRRTRPLAQAWDDVSTLSSHRGRAQSQKSPGTWWCVLFHRGLDPTRIAGMHKPAIGPDRRECIPCVILADSRWTYRAPRRSFTICRPGSSGWAGSRLWIRFCEPCEPGPVPFLHTL